MLAPFVTSLRRAWAPGLFAIVALLAWLVYAPGLRGGFVFDDFASLPALGAGGPVHDVPSALRYVTSGKADPTGRPIATLSFLIDAHDWPAAPRPFKRTNVLIHVLNGALLAWFLTRLGDAMGIQRTRARWAALLTSALWLLNPLLTSTVLYVVQREAMLPATCMLAAGLCWLQARSEPPGASGRALAWLVLGTGGSTLLAVLCKANGAVIPLLILACEWALPAPAIPGFRRRVHLLFGPPAIALLAWLAWMGLSSLGDGVLIYRGWSVGQRLLTEPSILWHYLGQLWLVIPTDTSVLHDGLAAATSLVQPWSTLPAIAGCIALLVAAFYVRRRTPALALAIVFFFAGHVMESTSIALELYFDHRNYLPAMLMFWPLAIAVVSLRRRLHAAVAAMVLVAISGVLTWQNTALWGDTYRQAMVWATDHPGSARSQAYAAQVAMGYGNRTAARSLMAAATARFGGEPQVALTNIDVQCAGGALPPSGLDYAEASLHDATREPGGMLLGWFDRAIGTAHAGNCQGLTPVGLNRLLDAALANPAIASVPGRRQDIEHARGQLALASGDAVSAAHWFEKALREAPTPSAALGQAAALGAAGRPDLGLAHLDAFRSLPPPPLPGWREGMTRIHATLLERQGYWQHEIDHLRAALQADARSASQASGLRATRPI